MERLVNYRRNDKFSLSLSLPLSLFLSLSHSLVFSGLANMKTFSRYEIEENNLVGKKKTWFSLCI
jgi:hypothetical protein